MGTDAPPESGPARRGSSTGRRVRRVVSLLALLLVVEYLVLPQLAGTRAALHLLGRIRVAWVVAGLFLEAASLAAYAQLTRSLLPRQGRPRLATVSRIQLSTLALSHVVPGGAAAGTGLGYDLLVRSGVSGPDAGFALAAQGLGSAIVLNLLLWVGLLVSIPGRGFNPLYAAAAAVGALLLAAFAAAVLSLTKGEERTVTVLRAVARHLPVVEEEAAHRLVHQLAARLRSLGADRALLARATGWAATNWLLDLASLWVFLAAFGHRTPVDGILVAYGLANVLAAIPITPGGLGIVEGVLIPTLVGFGSPRGVALLGVAAWRLVNFWLPIPVGAVSYLSLRRRSPTPAESLAEVAERAAGEAERPREWAERVRHQGPCPPDRRAPRLEAAAGPGPSDGAPPDAGARVPPDPAAPPPPMAGAR
ncbi:MAG: YbhN family protein [Acidimicrobiales bacterium]